MFKQIIEKFIGSEKYIVTIIRADTMLFFDRQYRFDTLEDVDEFVTKINNMDDWVVKKIEKVRFFDFKYTKEVRQTSIRLMDKNIITEEVDGRTFLKIDESLSNVTRVKRNRKKM